ncbi:MAG: phosphotransferase [Thermomicrobiales bacterium]
MTTGRTPGGSLPVGNTVQTWLRVCRGRSPGFRGIPRRCQPWLSACGSRVQTLRPHERRRTWFNPRNILVRDGEVVAIVDIGNAGSGTRATDLATLQWYTFEDPLDGARRRLWTRMIDLVGWEGAAVPTATQILTQLEFPIRQGRHDVIPGIVERGHRALDELDALR